MVGKKKSAINILPIIPLTIGLISGGGTAEVTPETKVQALRWCSDIQGYKAMVKRPGPTSRKLSILKKTTWLDSDGVVDLIWLIGFDGWMHEWCRWIDWFSLIAWIGSSIYWLIGWLIAWLILSICLFVPSLMMMMMVMRWLWWLWLWPWPIGVLWVLWKTIARERPGIDICHQHPIETCIDFHRFLFTGWNRSPWKKPEEWFFGPLGWIQVFYPCFSFFKILNELFELPKKFRLASLEAGHEHLSFRGETLTWNQHLKHWELVKRFFWGFALLVGASCLVCGDWNLRGKGTWRVIPVSKWLITMVCFGGWWDFQMAIHGL